MDLFSALGIGIISGIVTAMILFSGTAVFNKMVLPWYRGVIYKGIDLSGEWGYSYKKGDVPIQEVSISIRQNGHQLTGDLIATPVGGSDLSPPRFASFSGEVRDGYVFGHFQSKKPERVYYLGVLLKIVQAGKQLEGWEIGRDANSDNIITLSAAWKRIS